MRNVLSAVAFAGGSHNRKTRLFVMVIAAALTIDSPLVHAACVLGFGNCVPEIPGEEDGKKALLAILLDAPICAMDKSLYARFQAGDESVLGGKSEDPKSALAKICKTDASYFNSRIQFRKTNGRRPNMLEASGGAEYVIEFKATYDVLQPDGTLVVCGAGLCLEAFARAADRGKFQLSESDFGGANGKATISGSLFLTKTENGWR